MNTNSSDREMNESNAGAGMNSNMNDVTRGVRRNASHPGDASNAAGMRPTRDEDQDQDGMEGPEPSTPGSADSESGEGI